MSYKVCSIYTGWLKTWERCRLNHALMLPPSNVVIHYNENTNVLQKFTEDIWGYNKKKVPENIPINTMSMWYNMKEAFRLAPMSCDVYVRNRYDIEFEKPIKYNIEPNTVYIPDGNDYGGVNDQFAYGDYYSMAKYYSIIDSADELFQEHTFHSETYMKHHLNKTGVRVIRISQRQIIIR